ncbi:SDR family NAD(P)-dependent oxidoreductase [Streptomyces justiciae]|uniref:SDR family NAD(P)-dependent oxidoreductase n=1 Tax=Streptomyces justiciae TaxID=2780140 RepID=UPI0021199AB7|nr:SDR family oxidoreductase [Streptomyces justiciae]MCW8376175.1 SDR family oxidoreductase [Streptomyces justiciae]
MTGSRQGGTTAHTVLVTGAASGIGRHAALTYARRGHPVAAVDIDAGRLAQLPQQAGLHTFVCDVADSAALDRTLEDVEAALGTPTRVVHSAGIARVGRLLDQPLADIEQLVRVNDLGSVQVARAVVPRMAAGQGGDLILVASIAGWVPMTSVGAYSASKAAVVAMAEVLARECADSGVRVVCVCPPAVETPMLTEMQRSHPDVISDAPGIHPDVVLRGAERALARRRVLAFPGRGTTTLWRARRLAPLRVTRLLEAVLLKQLSKHRPAQSPAREADEEA